MKTETKRRVRVLRALAAYEPQELENFTEASVDPRRFLLVETNYRHGNQWAQTCETIEAATSAHDCQEYAEEWEPTLLLDLDTGERFTGETKTTWIRDEVTATA